MPFPNTDPDRNLDMEAFTQQLEGSVAAAAERVRDDDAEVQGDTQETTPEPAAPTATKVNIGGEEIEVDPRLADLIRREIDTRAGRYGSELDRMRRQLAELEARKPATTQEEHGEDGIMPPDPSLLDPASEKFNPTEYHRANLAYQEALVLHAMEALETQRKTEARQSAETQSKEAAWQALINRFYGTIAPELKGYEDVVNATWKRNAQVIREQPSDDDALKKLKELSLARINAIAEGGKAMSKAPTLVSSRRTAPAPKAPAKESEDEDTIGSLLKKQRAGVRATA